MNNFVRVANGFAPKKLDEEELKGYFQDIKSILATNLDVPNISLKAVLADEIITLALKITNYSFDEFIEANYANGSGPLADLMRTIIQYLNDEVGHKSVITVISVEENKLGKFHSKDSNINLDTHRSTTGTPVKGLDKLNHYSLYKLMEGIAPINVARILLLLGGPNYHGHDK